MTGVVIKCNTELIENYTMYLNLQFEQGDILFREDQRFYIHGDIMKVNLDKLL